jgi:predicted metal-dependent peptidase
MDAAVDRKVAAALKSLQQDRLRLLTRQPFIGMVLMSLELIPVPGNKVKTACTDGERIMMGMSFYATLDLEERLFVLAHEAWHCVLMHLVRQQTRDPRDFNIATDLEIHFILEQEKMKEPFVLPHKKEWARLSAEEIYERLRHHRKKEASGSPGVSGSSGASQGNSDEEAGRESAHIHGENGEGFDQHDFGGGDAPQTEQDRSVLAEKIRRIVIQAAQVVERTQGHLPAHIQGIVEKLRKPELPWQELLRQFVTSAYGGSRRWLPPERRHVFRKLYLPSYRSQRLRAVLALDTSGSTTGDLPQFFAELSSLLNSFGQYELTVLQCDCQIQHTETFTDEKRFPRDYRWESFGHGGTSFVPPFEYVREHSLRPDVFIYLTDGYGNAPDKPPRFPVLWVLTADGRKPAEWGRCIRLRHGREDGRQ